MWHNVFHGIMNHNSFLQVHFDFASKMKILYVLNGCDVLFGVCVMSSYSYFQHFIVLEANEKGKQEDVIVTTIFIVYVMHLHDSVAYIP